MQKNNETNQRIADLKAQIAMIQQDREDMHQAIIERSWRPDVKKRSIGSLLVALSMPMLAAFGILIGILIMDARGESSVLDPVKEPSEEKESSPVVEPDMTIPDEKSDESPKVTSIPEATKAAVTKKGGGKGGGKGKGNGKTGKTNPKITKKPPKDMILDFSKCGDDPMCENLLNVK